VKRCPNCNRTFNDDTLSFCLDDGTPLVGEPQSPDSEVTLVSPAPATPDDEATRVASPNPQAYGQLPGRPTWSASQYQAPVQAPYAASPPLQRKSWPWVLAIIAVLFIGGTVIVALAIVLPQMMHSGTNTNRFGPAPSPIPSPTRRPSPSPSVSPSVEESDEMPTDPDVALSQLTDLEDDWEQANVDADKDALDEILADEYRSDTQDKKHYLDTITPRPGRTWTFSNEHVQLNGTSAVLTFHLVRSGGGEAETSGNYADSFVWRDGRWQATASHEIK
jgi:hypothetical protein